MLIFLSLIALLTVFEVVQLAKKKQAKEIVLYSLFTLLILAFGIFYMAKPFQNGLAHYILLLTGIEK